MRKQKIREGKPAVGKGAQTPASKPARSRSQASKLRPPFEIADFMKELSKRLPSARAPLKILNLTGLLVW